MKNNKNIMIVVGIVLAIVVLGNFNLGGSKEFKKTSGETSTRSFARTSVYTNQGTTVSIAVNPGTSTYYVIDEKIPTGWTVVSASDSGDFTTTAGHIFWTQLSASGSHTYTYVVNPNSNAGTGTFAGTIGFQSKPEGAIGGSTTLTVVACTVSTEICDNVDNNCDYSVDNGVTPRACGSGGCVGTQSCSAGTWGTCTSSGNDCGTCCKCSSAGAETADLTQNSDCTATTCPADGCALGGCGTHIFSDYAATTPNTCSGLKACTSNSCTPTCTPDTDADGWAGTSSSFTACYDCNNADNTIYYSHAEICGDGKDNDCSGAAETYFNLADWGTPGGFCTGTGCCNNLVSMDEVLASIGRWKTQAFSMDNLLTTIGKYKAG